MLLALDNNRWKNDEGCAIDHFVSLFMNGGWKKMAGNKQKVSPAISRRAWP